METEEQILEFLSGIQIKISQNCLQEAKGKPDFFLWSGRQEMTSRNRSIPEKQKGK
jgi:hypothetical protein